MAFVNWMPQLFFVDTIFRSKEVQYVDEDKSIIEQLKKKLKAMKMAPRIKHTQHSLKFAHGCVVGISCSLVSFFGFISGLFSFFSVLMIRLVFIHIHQRGFPGIEVIHGLYSLSGKTSYRQISWSLEAARLDVAMVVSLWNLTGTSAAALPRYQPNFRAIGKV